MMERTLINHIHQKTVFALVDVEPRSFQLRLLESANFRLITGPVVPSGKQIGYLRIFVFSFV
jgi:hypothetical protein